MSDKPEAPVIPERVEEGPNEIHKIRKSFSVCKEKISTSPWAGPLLVSVGGTGGALKFMNFRRGLQIFANILAT